MVLATRCPHCQTTFRVAHDQLKLRAGIVRCGQCRQIFNGTEHLVPPAGLQPAENSGAAPEPAAPAALADQNIELPAAADAGTEDARWQDRQAAAPDFAPEAQEEPGFVTAARRQPQQARRNRWLFGTGCAILTLVLLAQAAYGLRNTLAAYLPQAKPALLAICHTLGCSIALPAHIDAISIESSELQARPGTAGALTLTLLLRNRSNSVQAWPNLELSLNDGTERVILRRVFAPREFVLSAADIAQGFAANSEKPVRLGFTLAQLQAAGYRVVLFYP